VELSTVSWTTVLLGTPINRWSHSGVGILRDGRLVTSAPGGGELLLIGEQTGAISAVWAGSAHSHGIEVVEREDGDGDELWIADPGPVGQSGQLIRMRVDGTVVARLVEPETTARPEQWKPTSTATVKGTTAHRGDLWIADGYGRSLVHRVTATGHTHTFDGSSTGVLFDCPHGIAIDYRAPQPLVAIADRGNERVVFLTLDGIFVRAVSDGAMPTPSSLALRGDDLLVTDLRGALLRIDRNDRVHVIVADSHGSDREGWPNRVVDGEVVAPEFREGCLNSPHGLAVGPSGAVYLTEWALGGRIIRLDLEPHGDWLIPPSTP